MNETTTFTSIIRKNKEQSKSLTITSFVLKDFGMPYQLSRPMDSVISPM